MITCIFILGIIGGCKKVFNDEPFTLKKSDYYGEEIRINGYFYNYYLSGQDSVVRLLILYHNGISIRTVTYESLTKFEEMFMSGEFSRSISDVSFLWGLFSVEDDSIIIEHYYPQGGIRSYTYFRSGRIINDTTFCLTSFTRPDGSELELIDETYHFKYFSPKPDSTTNFIK